MNFQIMAHKGESGSVCLFCFGNGFILPLSLSPLLEALGGSFFRLGLFSCLPGCAAALSFCPNCNIDYQFVAVRGERLSICCIWICKPPHLVLEKHQRYKNIILLRFHRLYFIYFIIFHIFHI